MSLTQMIGNIFAALVRSDLECRWKKLWRIEETRTLLKRTLFLSRKVLELSPFLGGTQASFADYSVFGAMMWARITSS